MDENNKHISNLDTDVEEMKRKADELIAYCKEQEIGRNKMELLVIHNKLCKVVAKHIAVKLSKKLQLLKNEKVFYCAYSEKKRKYIIVTYLGKKRVEREIPSKIFKEYSNEFKSRHHIDLEQFLATIERISKTKIDWRDIALSSELANKEIFIETSGLLKREEFAQNIISILNEMSPGFKSLYDILPNTFYKN